VVNAKFLIVIIGAVAGTEFAGPVVLLGMDAAELDAELSVVAGVLAGVDAELQAVSMPASSAADPINDERFMSLLQGSSMTEFPSDVDCV